MLCVTQTLSIVVNVLGGREYRGQGREYRGQGKGCTGAGQTGCSSSSSPWPRRCEGSGKQMEGKYFQHDFMVMKDEDGNDDRVKDKDANKVSVMERGNTDS